MQDESKTKVEVKDIALCAYTNRGAKGNPYLYVAGCNGQLVNIKKQFVRHRRLPDRCVFCNSFIDWRSRECLKERK